MKPRMAFLMCVLTVLFCGFVSPSLAEELFVFAGAASKPPTEDAAKGF